MTSLFTPNLGLVIWMFLIFLSVVFILGRYAWPFILKSLKDRSDFIEKGVENAKKAELELSQAQKKRQELLDQAHQEQLKIINETAGIKQKMMDDMRSEVANARAQLMEENMKSIAQAKLDAMREIRNEVVKLSVQISEKILRKQLDKTLVNQELISGMLKDLQTNN